MIDRLTKGLPTHNASTLMGPGDDCAVIDSGDKLTLITSQLFMEGVQFDLTYIDMEHLAYKAVMATINGAKRVQIGENDLELTKLEYAIIEFLSMNPGQVFDRERIYEKVCGYDAEGDSRVVTELIRRVRKKLAEYTQTEYIETVWGMGYRWKR